TCLPSSIALRAAACERFPREGRDQAEDEPEERRHDDVVATAPRGRLRRGAVREDARQLDLLRLEELLACGERILQHCAEEDGESRVARRTTSDCLDLLLVGRNAL